jgi:hypothetical protein|tara:strand:+ start:39121 stop:39558 length:438 start_codon:yes stop_codon:yes gene_type:complete
VESIRSIAVSDGVEISSVREAGHNGKSDTYWISQFAEDGGDAILSADTDFFKKPPQVEAVFKTGLKVIHLPKGWAIANRSLQAAHVFLWWERIEKQLSEMRPRQCYSPPYNLNDTGKLKQIPFGFQSAQKKIKRARKRGGKNTAD